MTARWRGVHAQFCDEVGKLGVLQRGTAVDKIKVIE